MAGAMPATLTNHHSANNRLYREKLRQLQIATKPF